jgi:hypothetical protein
MNQSAILRASYEAIYTNLAALGKETKLFAMGGIDEDVSGNESKVIFGVSDICQLSHDKNGEKVEENEKIFEAPTRVGFAFFLTVIAKEYPALLETAGRLIQYFKDNNYIQLEEYKWHGENGGKIFIEPAVRKPELRDGLKDRQLPSVTLEFLMEMGINSEKGTSFKRVEKKTIKGSIMDK